MRTLRCLLALGSVLASTTSCGRPEPENGRWVSYVRGSGADSGRISQILADYLAKRITAESAAAALRAETPRSPELLNIVVDSALTAAIARQARTRRDDH